MKLKKYFIFLFIMMLFMPLYSCKAADSYTASIVGSNGSVTKIGDYNDYTSAKNAAIAYNSNKDNVSVVYRNNKIVYAEYAIIRFASGNVVSLYPDGVTNTAYTSTHTSYGTDAAFIDYDSTTNRSKIKLSGYTGYVNADYLEVVPISSLASKSVKITATISITVRTGPGTGHSAIGSVTQGQVYSYSQKQSDGTYTWYNINYNGTSGWIASADSSWTVETNSTNLETYYENYSTGNVIHYYKHSTGQAYTNLGVSPSYLKRGVNYYSFDGNYFYDNLLSMLDDYKENKVGRAINKDNPFFSYYMYLPNHSMTGYTADDFNQIIKSKGYTSKSQSAMYGEGASFIASQDKYGVNAMLTFGAALNESDSGTSWIALNKNNLFGHGAYDSCPRECATKYNTVAEGVLAHAKMTGEGYNNPSDYRYYGSHYGNKASGMNVKYATDPYWGEKAASNAFNNDKKFGSQDFKSNTIGVKISKTNVPVRKTPSESGSVIYTLKNNSYSVEKIPLIVFDKVTANGYTWYKVYTDVALDDNQNKTSGDYVFEKSFGYVRSDYLYVENNQPTITAKDIELDINTNFNLLTGVSANDTEDGNITKFIKVVDNVNINKQGDYSATYTVEDSSRFRTSKTVKVKVKGYPAPVINASDISIAQYTEFNARDNVTATDSTDGNLTSKIQITKNTVNPKVLGTYEVTYSVTNANGKTTTKTIKVYVVKNELPVIIAEDRNILINSKFNDKEGVVATDKEDGNITSKIVVEKNNVNTSKLGTYQVTYKVTDKANQTVTKTINVKVVDKVLTKKAGRFYLDYLKKVDGNLEIKGYHTIEGVNNDLQTNIDYKLIFKNQNTNIEYSQNLSRITNENQMTLPILSKDGKNYKYSWFIGKVDINSLPEGDYTLYLMSSTTECYSISVVNNMLLNEEISQYSTNKMNATIINDYMLNDIPINMIIRKELIGKKETLTENNQYSYIEKIEIKNSKLHIRGASYSVNVDMRKTANVKRKIVFQNIDSYAKYIFDLNVLEKGTFNINLIVNDKFGKSKDKAWYDSELDISHLPKGKYSIYVVNTSNIEDYGELTDIMFADLSKATGNINNKNYTFILNESLRNRIELIIK